LNQNLIQSKIKNCLVISGSIQKPNRTKEIELDGLILDYQFLNSIN